jgi:hypothetical protein
MHTTPRRGGSRLFVGLVLVVIGVIFLLQQIGSFSLQNWWALFILIPAFGSFSSAWVAYRSSGRINEGVRAGLGGGLIVFVLALMFLFNLDWSIYWPLMVLVPGITVFFNGFTLPGSREATRPLAQRIYRPWTGWVGLGVIYIGACFLLRGLGFFEPERIHRNWWALAILLPAFGGLITAVRLAAAGTGLGWVALSNLAAVVVFTAVGVITFIGAGWNLITPIILISAGLILLTGVFRRR